MFGELPVVFIACQVFQEMFERFLPEALAEQVTYLQYGLHRIPLQIAGAVQNELDALTTPSLVVIGYGLCGSGITGIRSDIHTLLVPRMDDCIAMLLGSRQAYLHEFQAVPGTYWLSKGWLESGSHPLKEYEEYSERYGSKEAIWLLDQQYQNYERLALVAHSQQDLDDYHEQALQVARFCERWHLRYEEILGYDDYVKHLIEIALGERETSDEFVIISPGGEIQLDQFL